MRFYRLFICIIVSALISGCIGFQVAKDDKITDYQKDIAKSLIGESKENLIKKIGLPRQTISEGERQFLIFPHTSSSYGVATFFGIPFYIDPEFKGETLHCLRIELDSNDRVKDYHFKSTALPFRKEHYCRGLFWNEEESPRIDLYEESQTNPVNCISGGVRQCVEPSKCDAQTRAINTIPDIVSCFSCGKRQWVERSQCD
jgi:hypothetical protein